MACHSTWQQATALHSMLGVQNLLPAGSGQALRVIGKRWTVRVHPTPLKTAMSGAAQHTPRRAAPRQPCTGSAAWCRPLPRSSGPASTWAACETCSIHYHAHLGALLHGSPVQGLQHGTGLGHALEGHPACDLRPCWARCGAARLLCSRVHQRPLRLCNLQHNTPWTAECWVSEGVERTQCATLRGVWPCFASAAAGLEACIRWPDLAC